MPFSSPLKFRGTSPGTPCQRASDARDQSLDIVSRGMVPEKFRLLVRPMSARLGLKRCRTSQSNPSRLLRGKGFGNSLADSVGFRIPSQPSLVGVLASSVLSAPSPASVCGRLDCKACVDYQEIMDFRGYPGYGPS